MTTPRRWFPLGLALAGLTGAISAFGQAAPHPPTSGESPALPAGTATVKGSIVDPANLKATGGLPVALYALRPDGTSGIGQTRTDENGNFRFGGISNDPAIAYLVGTRYAEVPYGERTGFVPGQEELDIEIEVARPTADHTSISIEESTLRIEWVGTKLAVSERHRVVNRGKAPVWASTCTSTRHSILAETPL